MKKKFLAALTGALFLIGLNGNFQANAASVADKKVSGPTNTNVDLDGEESFKITKGGEGELEKLKKRLSADIRATKDSCSCAIQLVASHEENFPKKVSKSKKGPAATSRQDYNDTIKQLREKRDATAGAARKTLEEWPEDAHSVKDLKKLAFEVSTKLAELPSGCNILTRHLGVMIANASKAAEKRQKSLMGRLKRDVKSTKFDLEAFKENLEGCSPKKADHHKAAGESDEKGGKSADDDSQEHDAAAMEEDDFGKKCEEDKMIRRGDKKICPKQHHKGKK